MRMQRELRKRPGAREAGGDLVREDGCPQNVADGEIARFRFGEQRGERVKAGVTRSAAVAFVELAPAPRDAVREHGRVAVGARPPAAEHRGLACARPTQELVVHALDLGLVAGRDHRREIVRDDERGLGEDG
jgi:hypothetical protein